MASTIDIPSFDLASLADEVDPDPVLATWRAAGPLVGLGPLQWGVTRHADVDRLLKDRRVGHHLPLTYIQFALGDGASSEFRFNSILNRDAPEHTRLRRLMSQAFNRTLVLQMADWITSIVDDLLVPLLDGEPFDVVDDLAFPLPSQVICELLDIPSAERDEVRRRSTAMVADDRAAADEAVGWMRAYIDGVLTGRSPDRNGDLLQRMLAAEDGDDALTHAEIVDNAALLFLAGFETTKHLIAAGSAALLTNHDQRDLLWSEPKRSRAAVEEMLRFDGAVPFVVALAHEPVEVGPHVVEPGEVVYLLLRSANRDPDAFPQPDRFDITREPNPHLTFGGGLHLCLGAMLARLEGDIVFRRLAERTSGLELAGPIARPRSGSGSLTSVPVAATGAR